MSDILIRKLHNESSAVMATSHLANASTLSGARYSVDNSSSWPINESAQAHPRVQDYTQAQLNIVFGALAVILAFAAVVVGYMQLRTFRHSSDEESGSTTQDTPATLELK